MLSNSSRISPNNREAITAVSTVSSRDEYLMSTNGSLNVTATQSVPSNLQADVGTISSPINVGQTTSNTSATQLTASSIPMTNGILIEANPNNVSPGVYIGGAGATTGTGFLLQPGAIVPFTCANANLLYVIGANNTDVVYWNVL